jgi:glycopeptide antibiotics resistance protein
VRGQPSRPPVEQHRRARKTIAWVFTILVIAGLSFLLLGRTGPHRDFQKVNLIPSFDYLRIFVRMAYGSTPTRRDIRSLLIDGMGNILIFVPLGVALVAALYPARRIGLKVTLIGALVSLSFETLQYWIPNRVVETDDVLLNTAGTALGAVVTIALVHWLSRRPHNSQPAQPTSHD